MAGRCCISSIRSRSGSSTATTDLTTQIYQVFIKATPEEVWEAA